MSGDIPISLTINSDGAAQGAATYGKSIDSIKQKATEGAGANRQLNTSLKETAEALGVLEGPLNGITGRVSSLKELFSNTGIVFGAFAVATLAAFKALEGGIEVSIDAEKNMAQLQARLISTSYASGQTVDSLVSLSEELQNFSTYSKDAIQQSEGILLQFTNIGSQVFPQAQKAILDVSTALGMNLTSAAQLVGKALDNPIQGITSLQRVIGRVPADIQLMIDNLVKSGNTVAAQGVILDLLATKFGGAADAARNTLGGALDALKNKFIDLITIDPANLKGITSVINTLGNNLDLLGQIMSGVVTIIEIGLTAKMLAAIPAILEYGIAWVGLQSIMFGAAGAMGVAEVAVTALTAAFMRFLPFLAAAFVVEFFKEMINGSEQAQASINSYGDELHGIEDDYTKLKTATGEYRDKLLKDAADRKKALDDEYASLSKLVSAYADNQGILSTLGLGLKQIGESSANVFLPKSMQFDTPLDQVNKLNALDGIRAKVTQAQAAAAGQSGSANGDSLAQLKAIQDENNLLDQQLGMYDQLDLSSKTLFADQKSLSDQAAVDKELQKLGLTLDSEEGQAIAAKMTAVDQYKEAIKLLIDQEKQMQDQQNQILLAQTDYQNAFKDDTTQQIAIDQLKIQIQLQEDLAKIKGDSIVDEQARQQLRDNATVMQGNVAILVNWQQQAKAAHAAMDEFLSPIKSAVGDIQKSFSDMFLSIIQGGKDSFKTFAQSVLQIMEQLAAQVASLLVFNAVFGSITSTGNQSGLQSIAGALAGGSSGTAAGGASGGVGSAISGLSALSSIKGLLSGGLNSPLFAAGGSLANGINSIGATIGFDGAPAAGVIGPSAGLASSFTLGSSLASIGGTLLAHAIFGGNALGSTIGGTIGGIAGTIVGGPIGGGIGSFLGSAIGGLFGGSGVKHPASTFGGSISDGSLGGVSLNSDNMSTDFANTLSQQIGTLLTQLTASGITAKNQTVFGGYDPGSAQFGGPGGFIGLGSAANPSYLTKFDPNDPNGLSNALNLLAVQITKTSGVVNDDLTTALAHITTQGRATADVLADIQFALNFSSLDATAVTPLSAFQQSVASINATFDAAAATATRLGLAEDKVNDARNNALQQLVSGFDSAIDTQITNLGLGADSNLSPVDKLNSAKSQFLATFQQAQTGDTTAISGLQSAASTFLQLSKSYNASGSGYTSDYNLVLQSYQALKTQAATQAGLPGFAAGGTTPVNQPFLVGEHGPEIMQLGTPTTVTPIGASNDNTQKELQAMRADQKQYRQQSALQAKAFIDTMSYVGEQVADLNRKLGRKLSGTS